MTDIMGPSKKNRQGKGERRRYFVVYSKKKIFLTVGTSFEWVQFDRSSHRCSDGLKE